jgi:hypothetical protein
MHILGVLGLALLVAITGAIGTGTNAAALAATCIFFPAAIALYLSPAFIARVRQHPNASAIFVLDLVLGWTLVGWVGALVWAHTEHSPNETVGPVVLPEGVDAGAAEALRPSVPFATKQCPFCAEDIKREAIKCKHCGSDIAASARPEEIFNQAAADIKSDALASSSNTGVSDEQGLKEPAQPDARLNDRSSVVTWALCGLVLIGLLAALTVSLVGLGKVESDSRSTDSQPAEDAAMLKARKQACAHAVFEREYHPVERASYDAEVRDKCANFEVNGKEIR